MTSSRQSLFAASALLLVSAAVATSGPETLPDPTVPTHFSRTRATPSSLRGRQVPPSPQQPPSRPCEETQSTRVCNVLAAPPGDLTPKQVVLEHLCEGNTVLALQLAPPSTASCAVPCNGLVALGRRDHDALKRLCTAKLDSALLTTLLTGGGRNNRTAAVKGAATDDISGVPPMMAASLQAGLDLDTAVLLTHLVPASGHGYAGVRMHGHLRRLLARPALLRKLTATAQSAAASAAASAGSPAAAVLPTPGSRSPAAHYVDSLRRILERISHRTIMYMTRHVSKQANVLDLIVGLSAADAVDLAGLFDEDRTQGVLSYIVHNGAKLRLLATSGTLRKALRLLLQVLDAVGTKETEGTLAPQGGASGAKAATDDRAEAAAALSAEGPLTRHDVLFGEALLPDVFRRILEGVANARGVADAARRLPCDDRIELVLGAMNSDPELSLAKARATARLAAAASGGSV